MEARSGSRRWLLAVVRPQGMNFTLATGVCYVWTGKVWSVHVCACWAGSPGDGRALAPRLLPQGRVTCAWLSALGKSASVWLLLPGLAFLSSKLQFSF